MNRFILILSLFIITSFKVNALETIIRKHKPKIDWRDLTLEATNFRLRINDDMMLKVESRVRHVTSHRILSALPDKIRLFIFTTDNLKELGNINKKKWLEICKIEKEIIIMIKEVLYEMIVKDEIFEKFIKNGDSLISNAHDYVEAQESIINAVIKTANVEFKWKELDQKAKEFTPSTYSKIKSAITSRL